MILPAHKGRIRNDGRLSLDDTESFNKSMKMFSPGSRVSLIVAPEYKKATWGQMAYYWKVVLGSISTHTGHTPEKIHELLMSKLYGLVSGEASSMFSNIEMKEHIDYCRLFCFEMFGIDIPDPDRLWLGRHRDFK